MSEKMSLTQALLEIKLIDKKINKKIKQSVFIDLYKKKQKENGTSIKHLNIDEFEKEAKSNYDSIIALISRREKIKAELSKANAINIIKIGEKKYSISSAIELKKSILIKKNLVDVMRLQYIDVNNKLTSHNKNLNDQLHEMLLKNLGKETKVDSSEYEAVSKPLLEANELKIIDPLKLKKKYEEIENEIEEFESKVDCMISEANAKIEIEI